MMTRQPAWVLHNDVMAPVLYEEKAESVENIYL